MVLSELSRLVTERLQHGCQRYGLVRHSHVGASLADGRQASTQRQFAGYEVRSTSGATRLGIVVGEHHAF